MRDIVYVENRKFVGITSTGFKVVDVIDKSKQYFLFDDVDYLIFDSRASLLSEKLIASCIDHDICVMFCDQTHSPIELITSVYGQKERFKKLSSQLELPKKTKDRLWRKIVVSKIINQADCLYFCRIDKTNSQIINSISKQVTEGDRENVEAYAARLYFPKLFGDKFKRGRYDDVINSGLNYGYAIIRNVIRREIVMHGFEPTFGLHHVSTENPFNLADDLMESFRPFVDRKVYEILQINHYDELTDKMKKQILEILLEKCIISNKVFHLSDAIKLTVESYGSCVISGSSASLKLPEFIKAGR